MRAHHSISVHQSPVTVASGSDALINKKFANLSSSEMEVLKSENISDRITDKITVSMEDMK